MRPPLQRVSPPWLFAPVGAQRRMSSSRMVLMNAIAGPSLGFSRSATLRSLGTALAKASRTIRRCTPSFFPTPLIVPTPCSYSLRISSNSSTFLLLFNRTSFPASIWRNEGTRFLVVQGGANSDDRKGPIQSIEITLKSSRSLSTDSRAFDKSNNSFPTVGFCRSKVCPALSSWPSKPCVNCSSST